MLAEEPALVEQALLETLEFVREAHPLDAVRIEGVARSSAQAALIEYVGDLRVCIFV